MREVKRRSPVPVYLAAAAYALYALLFPLYRSWHFLIAAIITAAVWLAADALIKPKTEYVPDDTPEPEAPAGNPAVTAILDEAQKFSAEMGRLSASIGKPDITAKIERLVTLSDAIAKDAADDDSDIPSIQKFQSYFLPSTIALLNSYDRLSAPQVQGGTMETSMNSIAEMLDTEITSFEKQLDALYRNDSMSIDADIRVMQNLLQREGLMPDDDLQKLMHAAQGV